MHISLPSVLAALLVASEVSATMMSPRAHHGQLARRINRKKRCLQRTPTASPSTDQQASPTSSSTPSPQTYTPAPAPSPSSNNNNGGGDQTGTIQNASGGPCGDPNASTVTTTDNGPNGQESWLNCGITGGGWTPPPVTLDNLIYVDLNTAMSMSNTPFQDCSNYVQQFQDMAGQTGIPAVLLMSIALQESSCQSGATGPNGEIGLMQITPDKCPSSGDCYDPATNIGIGGNYFQSQVDAAGGNLANALGGYNGWFPGMTVADADDHPTCGARNNLDYIHSILNGFCQGIDPSTIPGGMGTFRNNVC